MTFCQCFQQNDQELFSFLKNELLTDKMKTKHFLKLNRIIIKNKHPRKSSQFVLNLDELVMYVYYVEKYAGYDINLITDVCKHLNSLYNDDLYTSFLKNIDKYYNTQEFINIFASLMYNCQNFRKPEAFEIVYRKCKTHFDKQKLFKLICYESANNKTIDVQKMQHLSVLICNDLFNSHPSNFYAPDIYPIINQFPEVIISIPLENINKYITNINNNDIEKFINLFDSIDTKFYSHLTQIIVCILKKTTNISEESFNTIIHIMKDDGLISYDDFIIVCSKIDVRNVFHVEVLQHLLRYFYNYYRTIDSNNIKNKSLISQTFQNINSYWQNDIHLQYIQAITLAVFIRYYDYKPPLESIQYVKGLWEDIIKKPNIINNICMLVVGDIKAVSTICYDQK